jgi:hypothetical protein
MLLIKETLKVKSDVKKEYFFNENFYETANAIFDKMYSVLCK